MAEKRLHGSMSKMQRRRAWWGRLFILPWFIGALFFFVLPMLTTVVWAFSNVNFATRTSTFIGITNFRSLFTEDADFLPNLLESVGSVVLQVPVIVVFSLFIAMILRQKFIGRTACRAIFFFPVIIASGVVITILRTQVMMTDSATSDMQQAYMFSFPAFDSLTQTLGLPMFITEFVTGIVNGFFDITWKSGVQIVLLLAAVNHISPSSYEAADIEGATAWEKLWKITFPLISPTILVVVIYSIIDSFTDYGNTVMKSITDYFHEGMYAYSNTIALIYFVTILLVVGLVHLIVSRFVFYSTD